jgi:ParB family chromosome partitioning protein
METHRKVPRNGDRPVPLRARVKAKTPVAKIATNARVIPIDQIGNDPDQPRREFDPASIERLAESLKSRGQLQPILVRWDSGRNLYVILCGERRWRAAMLAGLPSLTCIVGDRPLSKGERRTVQLIENCCREDLAPVDQAEAMHALVVSEGWTQAGLAGLLGITQSAVSKALALLELPPVLRGQVVLGALSASVARELAKIDDPTALGCAIKSAIADRWTQAIALKEASARSSPPSDPVRDYSCGIIPEPASTLNRAKRENPIARAVREGSIKVGPAPTLAPQPNGDGRGVPTAAPASPRPSPAPAPPPSKKPAKFATPMTWVDSGYSFTVSCGKGIDPAVLREALLRKAGELAEPRRILAPPSSRPSRSRQGRKS